ncbi:MAG TPA: glycosyltransferase family 87 protein [Roseiflexaceae bacterium]
MTPSEQFTAQTRQITAALRTPRGALRGALLVVLLALWCLLGVWVFGTTTVDSVSLYDFVVIHAAGRAALAGGDPYSREFIASLHADPHGTGYAYPLASLWVLLPFLPFPIALAATLWVSVSIAGLVALAPLMGSQMPRWVWLAPLLFYPSLYALKITQWAPIQMALLACSLWLYRRGASFWAGFLLPLVTVKPTTGLPLLVLGVVMCAADRRWWTGAILGGLIWYGAPLLLQPDWPLRWLATLRDYADPVAGQFLVTLTDLPDGRLCAATAALIALWSIGRRRTPGLACALLVLSMLVTPHRAQYDYPLFYIPMLFLPRRHLWLAVAAVVLSWGLPLTFELGWNSSLQLTLFIVAPAILACALVADLDPRVMSAPVATA